MLKAWTYPNNDDLDALTRTHQRSLAASSSHSIPASSSKNWKFDVFISFKGEGARMNFVDHLYYALKQQGISTFRDDVILSKGEAINPSILNGIQESRIALIIFSRNYAASSWCLDELAYIMQQYRYERARVVIPIFYNVHPSDVIKQIGESGKGVSGQYKSANNDKVELWRKAFIDASNIAGLNIAGDRHESQAIQDIVATLSKRFLRLMPNVEASAETNANADLIRIETRTQELKSLLEVGSGGVRMVGICGVWGSGKSTLASCIYDEIKHEFEGCCFIKDVQAESRMHGLKMLQEKILSDVLKSKVSLKSIKQGTLMMKRRLSYNSVLIVLDDVNHINHLKMLVGSHDWFGDGSRIIITTRNQDLVKAHKVNTTYNVRMLDDKEAIMLFSRNAFRAGRPAEAYEEISQSMVSKCGGNPLALVTLGSYLHGKYLNEWTNTLAKLRGIPIDEILEKFKYGDDGVMSNIFSEFLA